MWRSEFMKGFVRVLKLGFEASIPNRECFIFCIDLFELLLLYLEMIFLIKWLSGCFSWFNGSLRDLCIWVRLVVARSPLSPPTDYQSTVTYCQPTSPVQPFVWMVNWLNICKLDSVESGNGLSPNPTWPTDRPVDTPSLS